MRCVCLRLRPCGSKPCTCAQPVEKCLVLCCYHPGVTPYPPDPTFGKFCEPHAELFAITAAAEKACAEKIRALEAELGW